MAKLYYLTWLDMKSFEIYLTITNNKKYYLLLKNLSKTTKGKEFLCIYSSGNIKDKFKNIYYDYYNKFILLNVNNYHFILPSDISNFYNTKKECLSLRRKNIKQYHQYY